MLQMSNDDGSIRNRVKKILKKIFTYARVSYTMQNLAQNGFSQALLQTHTFSLRKIHQHAKIS